MATKETTTTYRWPEGSTITRIDVRTQSNGRAVAYLYADEGEAAHQQRFDIRSAIRLKGWGTLSDYRNGQFGLRVSGLKDGKELVDMLKQQGFVAAPVSIDAQTADNHQSKNIGGFIKDNSLRLSAAIYTVGNAFYYASGVAAKNKERRRMALSFGAGDAALGLFGGSNDSQQFKSLLTGLKSHMEDHGIEIPKNASIHVETSHQDQGLLGTASELLHRHINSIKILAEVLGGFFILRSGLKGDGVKKNSLEITSGIVVMTGWAGALLVKEKKPDPEKLQQAGAVEKLGAYIQEKPLRLAGYAGLTFNALNAKNSWNNRHDNGGKFGLAAVGSMVSANTLYSISNKSPGGDIRTDAMISDVYSVAAQILNKQPEGTVRDAAIESTAKFLGERTEIKDNHQQIIARLKEEMTIQRKNPWFETRGLAPYRPTPQKRHVKVPGLDEAPDTVVQAEGRAHAPLQEHATAAHIG